MSDVFTVIDAHAKDLGDGFVVRRALPQMARRMVGPFTFFDHMGPAELAPGHGMDVRPHPHIGLATVTYLYEGAIFHRDSLGSEQVIRPGDINWMTAGRGIVHSERSPDVERAAGGTIHGLQLWVALPVEHEETEPTFVHHPSATLPEREENGARLRVLAGSAYGMKAPVATFSPLFYVDVTLPAGAEIPLTDEHEERALYVVEGAVTAGGERAESGRMLVFGKDAKVSIRAEAASRIALVGGAPLEGKRYIDWNFVSSSKERLEKAKDDWRAQRFPKVPGDEAEFIPLP